jgi:hypothetical protein
VKIGVPILIELSENLLRKIVVLALNRIVKGIINISNSSNISSRTLPLGVIIRTEELSAHKGKNNRYSRLLVQIIRIIVFLENLRHNKTLAKQSVRHQT